ncbi:putative baseplate assembly protein [Luedemannella flava]
MTLPVPHLDDRTFDGLVAEALERAGRSCPEWTDRSVHDPGVALVEVFAHLTEVMLYRLNRLPEKAYVEFLNLLGVHRHPPAAAWVPLTFTRAPTATEAITIPAGTQATAKTVSFTVTQSVVLAAGQAELTVPAYHCEVVEGELVGVGTGAPGQSHRVARPPIATTTEAFDVLLGVEVPDRSLAEGVPARTHNGRTFEIWRPVATFAGAGPTDKVYVLNRGSGVVSFAPALDLGDARPVTLAAVPPANREIRLWYRTGGGPEGNVAAGTLTTLRTPIPGLSVTNREPARGGRALETIESALARGPYEFYGLQRAVTARDFELLATSGSASVARARAFTRTAMWSHARPGEVETVLVPHVDPQARPDWRLPMETVVAHQGDAARDRVQQDLDARRALGTTVVTTWARYKAVAVKGRLVVRAEDDPDVVRRRIHDRLHQTVSPLPTPANPTGWGFGEPLRASNVYRWLEQAEPGVRYVDEVRFELLDAPDKRVRALAADAYQADTWYAGCEEVLFRSTNGARGWEAVRRFPGETIRRVVPAQDNARPGVVARPGTVAVVSQVDESGSARVHVSDDLGEAGCRWSRWRTRCSTPRGSTATAWPPCCWPPTPACTRWRPARRPCRCRSRWTRLTRISASTRSARSSRNAASSAWPWPRRPSSACTCRRPAAGPARSPTSASPASTPAPWRSSWTGPRRCCGPVRPSPTPASPARAASGPACSRRTCVGSRWRPAGSAAPVGASRSWASRRSPPRRAAACCAWTPAPPARSGSPPTSTPGCRCATGRGSSPSRPSPAGPRRSSRAAPRGSTAATTRSASPPPPTAPPPTRSRCPTPGCCAPPNTRSRWSAMRRGSH